MQMTASPGGTSSNANISAFRLDINNVAPSSKVGSQLNMISLLPFSLQSCVSSSSEQQLLHQNIYSMKIHDARGVTNCQFLLLIKDTKKSRERKVHCNLPFAACYLKSNNISKLYFKCSAASVISFRPYLNKEIFDGTTELSIQCATVPDVARDDIEGVKAIAMLYLSTEEYIEKLTIADNKMQTAPGFSCLRRTGSAHQVKTLNCICNKLNWDVQEAMKCMQDLSFTSKARLILPVRLRPDMLALSRFMHNPWSPVCSNGINVTHGHTEFRIRFVSDTKCFILLLVVIIGLLIPAMFIILVKALIG